MLLSVTTALHAQQPPVFDKSNTSFVADQQVTVGVEMNSNNWNSLLESTVRCIRKCGHEFEKYYIREL